MVCGRGRSLLLAAAVLVSLVGAGTARAGTSTVPDADDVSGRLDISSASDGHAGTKTVTHTIRTFAAWPVGLIGPRTPNYFLLELSTDADPAPERSVLIVSSAGHMVGLLFGPNSRFITSVHASRPNRHTVKVSIPRSRLGNPAGYKWQAFSFFRAPGACHAGCQDRAPDGTTRVLHDLRAPTIDFPAQPVPADVGYDVNFSVADTGGSGVASWSLQHRLFGTTTWAEVDNGNSGGPQVSPQLSAEDQDDQFRVVATDGHGNTRTSLVRTVSVPVDDDSFTYAGTWATGGSITDFLGTLHTSTDTSATATYIFNGSYVALVAPGGTGTARVTINGSNPVVVHRGSFSGPRRIVFQRSLANAAERTLKVEVMGGTFVLDGIIVR